MDILSAEILKIVALSAVGTFGVIEALKPSIKKFSPDSLPRLAVRLGALLVGAGWGFEIQHDATGAISGVCGAALSSTIVAAVKGVIKSRAARG